MLTSEMEMNSHLNLNLNLNLNNSVVPAPVAPGPGQDADGGLPGVRHSPGPGLDHQGQGQGQEEEESPEVDIHISNVVCNFATRCHLNLRQVANNAAHVIYKREQAMVSMKLRFPRATASIWSSGKITVTGSTSEDASKKAARRIARILQKMGFRVRFTGFRIVNVLGTVNLPFGIKITQFTEAHPRVCSYEPELHPGATYRFKEEKAVLKVFQTGAITVTAPSVSGVEAAIQHIYPLVYAFKKEKPNTPHLAHMKALKRLNAAAASESSNRPVKKRRPSVASSDEEEEVNPMTSEEEAEFTDNDLNHSGSENNSE